MEFSARLLLSSIFQKSSKFNPKRERLMASLAECAGRQCNGVCCLDFATNLVEKRLGHFQRKRTRQKTCKFEPSRRDHGCTRTFLLDAESARAAQFRKLVTSPVAETLSAKDKTKPEIDSEP